eukprot:GHVP01021673.1.p1 GENE.GHVP01021673.1~~GHVP01021673.1.p1  ORF type:complete len:537 (+),score=96.19 GHVP01021673.1:35-1612(+)
MAPKEEEIDPTQYRQNRKDQIVAYCDEYKRSPYPHKFAVTMTNEAFIAEYSRLENEESLRDVEIRLAGRIFRLAAAGNSLKFYDLVSNGHKVQMMASEGDHEDSKISFLKSHEIFRRGDIMGVVGYPGRTKRGELSIHALRVELLSPCFHMLPKSYTGLKDQETRYRQRYLDLIVNEPSRQIFVTRSKIIKFIRRYLEEMDFIEVETPMMNAIPGGAAARPFVTLHNELNQTMYMRVAPELYLKMLVIGGLERCFEIGKNFRNEGIDATHNPEFTSAEFYMAFADLYDLLDITEKLVSNLVMEIKGSYKAILTENRNNPKKKTEKEIDFTPPYQRLPMVQTIEERSGVTLPRPLESEECIKVMREIVTKHRIEMPKPATAAKLLDKLCGHFIEDRIVNPTFVTEHPLIMSPLAKWHREKDELAERGELFINGKEVANFYTELNDPERQLAAFMQQTKDREEGDIESMPLDEGYVTALEFGLPPTGGWGLGIDRMVMMLTDCDVIKDVILFPALRNEKCEKIKAKK